LLAYFICLPVKLRLNPFSLANAEQEILAGPLTEFDGRRLALWELAHGLEWVTLSGAMVCLAVPVRSSSSWLNAVGFSFLSLLLVLLLTALESATARLKLPQATRVLWRWASLPAVLALATAVYSWYARV
jgi:NADH-quinone oxidoreductase subunit H